MVGHGLCACWDTLRITSDETPAESSMARESPVRQRRVSAFAIWNRLILNVAKLPFSDSLFFFQDFIPFHVVVPPLETLRCTLSLSAIIHFLSFLGLISLFSHTIVLFLEAYAAVLSKLDFDHRHLNP